MLFPSNIELFLHNQHPASLLYKEIMLYGTLRTSHISIAKQPSQTVYHLIFNLIILCHQQVMH
jgi:hypothetical protein